MKPLSGNCCCVKLIKLVKFGCQDQLNCNAVGIFKEEMLLDVICSSYYVIEVFVYNGEIRGKSVCNEVTSSIGSS